MTTNLNALGTEKLNDEVDFANLPEQGGSFTPPPQPGSYRFALPKTLKGENFTAVQSTDHGPRVQVKFDETAPLTIVQSKDNVRNGEPFETQLSNVPRNRARKGQPVALVSDWDYLNKALGLPTRPASNKAYAETLLASAKEGKEFGADIEWSWSCNPKRDARFPMQDEAGNETRELGTVPTNEDPAKNVQGCGARYYQQAVAKVPVAGEDGKTVQEYPLYITCSCQAKVRGFGNLTRFKE